MDIKLPTETDALHHAYLIEDADDAFTAVDAFVRGNTTDAEIHVREFDSFGIDDSRELLHLATMRSLGDQFFVYRMRSCTGEAQNALLKLFEEPPQRTYFFFCLNGVRDVLPTLRSRVQILGDDTGVHGSTSGEEFISAPVGHRLKLLEPIIKDKDVAAASALLRDIEYELYTNRDRTKSAEALRHIVNVRTVLNDKGASVKTLMESVAIRI